jgi:hypothetical protein
MNELNIDIRSTSLYSVSFLSMTLSSLLILSIAFLKFKSANSFFFKMIAFADLGFFLF